MVNRQDMIAKFLKTPSYIHLQPPLKQVPHTMSLHEPVLHVFNRAREKHVAKRKRAGTTSFHKKETLRTIGHNQFKWTF